MSGPCRRAIRNFISPPISSRILIVIDRFGNDYDWKANYAAVLRSFPVNTDDETTAQQIISEVDALCEKGHITMEEMREYDFLWGRSD